MAGSWKQELARVAPMAACAVLLGIATEMIVMVRPVEPVGPPLPRVDLDSLDDSIARDRQRAARTTPLPEEIRAIGTAFRCWNAAAAGLPIAMGGDASKDANELVCPGFPKPEAMRDELAARIGVARTRLGPEQAMAALDELRSIETESFAQQLAASAQAHVVSDELKRLSGSLTKSWMATGWMSRDARPLVPMPIARIGYKLYFATVLFDPLGQNGCGHSIAEEKRTSPAVCYGLETPSGNPLLPLDFAELRAFSAFLVRYPLVPPQEQQKDPTAARDRRRLAYLDRFAELDGWARAHGGKGDHPLLEDYRAELARGVLLYRLGNFDEGARVVCTESRKAPKFSPAENWCLAMSDASVE